MVTEIYIHVGLSKTGTTFLQKELFPKLKNCHFICRPLFCEPFIMYLDIKQNRKNIISDERLSVNIINEHKSYYGKPDMRFVVADRLHALFPNAKIIIGIREKESWLRSRYFQYIREDGFFTIRNYDEFRNMVDEKGLDFENYITYLQERFSDVFIYQFEDFIENQEKVLSDLCNFIGVEVPEYTNRIVNPGLSRYHLGFIYVYDKICRSKTMHYLLRKLIGLVRPYR